MQDFIEKTTNTTEVFDGKIIRLQVDDVELPNGKKAKREIVRHPGAVAIIPVTKHGTIIFVKQYRKPLEKTLIEIPAGKLEPGEAPKSTAIRELEEETGYTTKDINLVTTFYTSPGFADEYLHIYITKDLQALKEPPQGDEDEYIELVELTLEEAKQYVEENRIHDAKTNYAILYLEMLECRK